MDNSSFDIPEKTNVDDADILLPSWWFQPIYKKSSDWIISHQIGSFPEVGEQK